MKYREAILILVAFCAATRAEDASEDTKDIMKETLPAYSVASSADLLNSTRCRKELEDFRDAVEHRILWAVKLLDASGQPEPGFVYGNRFWLGKREQCTKLTDKAPIQLKMQVMRNNSRYRNPDEEFPPFDVHYFIVRVTHNSTRQYQVRLPLADTLTLGLCLPASCTTNEISMVLERIFQDRILLFSRIYSADFKLAEVTDLRDDHQWLRSGISIFMLSIVAFNIILLILGTFYDMFVFQKRLETKKKFLTYENNNTADGKHDAINEDEALSALEPESRFGMIIMCFSVYTNTKKIFNTDVSSPGSVPVLHGMKFFGMMWIIMIHTIYYSYAYIDNEALAYKTAHDVGAQIVSNATFSVDTFFFISGFLVAYLYWLHSKNNKTSRSIGRNVNTFCMLFLKRCIRITPSYMLFIGLAILNFSWYRETSVFVIPEKPEEICTKYWWRNMLFINNLFDRETMCLSWSWYISCDMQFFTFGSFLLILSSLYFYTSVFLAVFAVIGSIILNGYITYIYNYIPTLDEAHVTLATIYDPPWLRIPPYIFGMATAYYLIKINNELHLKKVTLVACWCFGIVCNCSILFGLFQRQIPLSSSVLYAALSRTGWSVGIAWFIIACCTNNAGVIKDFLSYGAWVPLSKLTFGAYLLNPLLINSIYMYSEKAFHEEFLTTGSIFLGMVMCTYICAYAFTLMLEAPCILLMKLFLSPNSKRK